VIRADAAEQHAHAAWLAEQQASQDTPVLWSRLGLEGGEAG